MNTVFRMHICADWSEPLSHDVPKYHEIMSVKSLISIEQVMAHCMHLKEKLDLLYLSEFFHFFEIYEYIKRVVRIGRKLGHDLTRLALGMLVCP